MAKSPFSMLALDPAMEPVLRVPGSIAANFMPFGPQMCRTYGKGCGRFLPLCELQPVIAPTCELVGQLCENCR